MQGMYKKLFFLYYYNSCWLDIGGFFHCEYKIFSRAMAVLSGSFMKPCLRGLSYVSFSFVRRRGKVKLCNSSYNNAVSVFLSLNV